MTTIEEKYVCAFRGRRDSYQVPLALAEGGILDQFITDAYATPWMHKFGKLSPEALRRKLKFRSEPGLPSESVRCLWGTTLIEHLRHHVGIAPTQTFNKLDPCFSYAAAQRAAQSKADLLLYSPYAWEAFTQQYSHTPRKVLFQYHPHPDVERRILAADSNWPPNAREPLSGAKYGEATLRRSQREQDVWKHADLVLCASNFTLRSLTEMGADERLCHVIPYGVEPPTSPEADEPGETFHAAFVGSGGQRKGLHHLLACWRRAKLPPSSRLTLVCRVIDREIERLARATPGVEVFGAIPSRELNELYAKSSLFVMPSLVEGFGQVYLEALRNGCPVLGTTNTALPDLGCEKDGIFCTTPGEMDELIGFLEKLSTILPGNRQIRRAARDCARRFTWPAFRQQVRSALGQSTPSQVPAD